MRKLFLITIISLTACLLLCSCASKAEDGDGSGTGGTLAPTGKVTEAETERGFDGAKGEAYEIAVQYCIDNYGESYEDFEVGFEISNGLWRVYFYKTDSVVNAPDISIDPSTGEVVSCIINE